MGFKKTSHWVPDFFKVLQSLGIQSTGIRKDFYNKNDKSKFAYLFNIKIRSWLSCGLWFNIKRKTDRIEEYVKTILNDYTPETPTGGVMI